MFTITTESGEVLNALIPVSVGEGIDVALAHWSDLYPDAACVQITVSLGDFFGRPTIDILASNGNFRYRADHAGIPA
jgi:hypothetical protein